MKSFFVPREVCELVGISYRQLQYWDKTNFIKPSYKRKGKYRLYTFSDLLQLTMASTLRSEHQLSVQRLRTAIRMLRDLLPKLNSPLIELSIWYFKAPRGYTKGRRVLTNNDSMLIHDGDVVMAGGFLLGAGGTRVVQFRVRDLQYRIEARWPQVEVPPE